MTALASRIGRLEGRLLRWKFYFLMSACLRQQKQEAEARRCAEEKARAAELEARAARAAVERERREAEVAAERAARSQAESAPPPELPPPPPVWTYDPPPEMQIRPVHWRRSVEPHDYGGTNGRALTDYDPLRWDDDDYDDD